MEIFIKDPKKDNVRQKFCADARILLIDSNEYGQRESWASFFTRNCMNDIFIPRAVQLVLLREYAFCNSPLDPLKDSNNRIIKFAKPMDLERNVPKPTYESTRSTKIKSFNFVNTGRSNKDAKFYLKDIKYEDHADNPVYEKSITTHEEIAYFLLEITRRQRLMYENLKDTKLVGRETLESLMTKHQDGLENVKNMKVKVRKPVNWQERKNYLARKLLFESQKQKLEEKYYDELLSSDIDPELFSPEKFELEENIKKLKDNLNLNYQDLSDEAKQDLPNYPHEVKISFNFDAQTYDQYVEAWLIYPVEPVKFALKIFKKL